MFRTHLVSLSCYSRPKDSVRPSILKSARKIVSRSSLGVSQKSNVQDFELSSSTKRNLVYPKISKELKPAMMGRIKREPRLSTIKEFEEV
mmetsp:Transcript_18968/g.21792  ORF Transcript_18968/g.21792 Transcript_18968/m.21792 type:complete len:90 (+) Transcript_18968:705-974(+)